MDRNGTGMSEAYRICPPYAFGMVEIQDLIELGLHHREPKG